MKKTLLAFAAIAVAAVLVLAIFVPNIITTADKDYPINSDEPDLPAFLDEEAGDFNKEEFMMRRGEAIALRRGIFEGMPFTPALRPQAIEKMEAQESRIAKLKGEGIFANSLQAAWTPIGPAPIPNGQTTPSAPVSGRTIAIAVHPADENIVYVGTAQGGVYRSTNGGTTWTAIFDSAQSLAIGAIAFAPSDPTIIYVGTGEPNFAGNNYFGVGVYRVNTNAAHTTATLNGPLNLDAGGADVFTGRGIGEVLVHPTNPDIIFVATTSGSGGLRRAENPPFPSRGVYRSTNASTATPTFAKLTGLAGSINASVRDMALDPADPDNLVVNLVAGSGTGGLYTSTNALAVNPTFTQTQVFNSNSTSELTAEFGVYPTIVPLTNPVFYAATGNGGGRVLISTDSGTTWTQQIDNDFCTPQCFYDIAIDVDPIDPARLYIGGSPNLIVARSDNAGVSFPVAPTAGLHVDTHALAVAPSERTVVYLGTDGGIYRSADSGASFTPLNNTQFSATQFNGLSVHPTDPNFTIGGTQDNGTNFYSPAGNWTNVRGGDGGFTVIDQNAVDTVNVRMYHTFFNQISRLIGYETRANIALPWTFRGCGNGSTPSNGINCNDTAVNFYAPLERGPGTPNTTYYGTDRVYRSADTGLTHTIVSQGPIVAGVPISSIGVGQTNDNARIVGLNNGAIFGTGTGANPLVDLDPTNTVPNVPINRSIVDPNTATTAYVTLSVFGIPNVYKTTNLGDAGTTWVDASGTGGTAIPRVPVNAIIVDPLNSTYVYVGTDIGVYVSTDGGGTWNPFGTGLPRVAVFDIQITNPPAPDQRMVRIATYGRGMYEIPALAPTAASVSVSGRVIDNIGRGISRTLVKITDQNGNAKSATTNQFGYYRFSDIEVGETYVVKAQHKRYRFNSQVITVNDSLTNLNLIGEGGGVFGNLR